MGRFLHVAVRNLERDWPWSVRLYEEIIHELWRVDYRPYRRTDPALYDLYHCIQCRQCMLPGFSCWRFRYLGIFNSVYYYVIYSTCIKHCNNRVKVRKGRHNSVCVCLHRCIVYDVQVCIRKDNKETLFRIIA